MKARASASCGHKSDIQAKIGGAVARDRYVAKSENVRRRPADNSCPSRARLTTEILRAKRDIPNRHDNARDETPNSLNDNYNPSSLEIIGKEGVDPDGNDSDS